jgi:putative transposase
MCLSIPPKYAVSNVIGYIKGTSAIQIGRKYGGRQRNFTGLEGTSFPQRGLDEHMMRAHIPNQEEEDERCDQMKLVMD